MGYSPGMNNTTANPWQNWVGRSVLRHDVVSQRLVAQLRSTLSPFLFGDDHAIPPGLHWALAPATPAMNELSDDGTETHGLVPPQIDLPRRMWAGGTIETFGDLAEGRQVSRRSTLSDIHERSGRSGRLCLISITHEIMQQDQLMLRERQDLVFREPGAPREPAPGEPWQTDLLWRIDLTPQLLFRFSAITFNGHRIHYDQPYAVATEGYAGLVVHGPLQAAILLNQTATVLGRAPRRFDYRCVSPLIAGQIADVESRKSDVGVAARIRNAAGIITCEAAAQR